MGGEGGGSWMDMDGWMDDGVKDGLIMGEGREQ